MSNGCSLCGNLTVHNRVDNYKRPHQRIRTGCPERLYAVLKKKGPLNDKHLLYAIVFIFHNYCISIITTTLQQEETKAYTG